MSQLNKSNSDIEAHNVQTPDLNLPDYLAIVFICCLLISIPVRIINQKLKIAISQNAFLMMIATTVGVMAAYLEWFEPMKNILIFNPSMFYHTFIPVFITSTMFRMQHFLYIQCLPQVMTMVCLGIFISTGTLTVLLTFILHRDWPLEYVVLTSLMLQPIQPLHIVLTFTNATRCRFLKTMLDAESVWLLIPVSVLIDFICDTEHKVIKTVQQGCLIILRQFLGGLIIGYIIGKIGGRIMRWLYNDPSYCVIVTMGLNFFVYFACEFLLQCSGPTAIVLLNGFFIREKHRMTNEVSLNLTYFWSFLYYASDIGLLMIVTGSVTVQIVTYFRVKDFYNGTIIYLVGVMLRILSYIILNPLLNVMTYQLNMKSLLVLGWADVKGCINLIMGLRLLYLKTTTPLYRKCLITLFMYTYYSTFINTGLSTVIMRLMKMMNMSAQAKRNLNNCMLYIMEKRSELMNILKTDRFLVLGNWHRVRLDTYLNLPFENVEITQYEELKKAQDETVWVDGQPCPGCIVDFPSDLTEDSLSNLLKEVEANLLKAKKIEIMKQYENGYINDNCVEVLLHYLDILYESNREERCLSFHSFLRPNKFFVCVRKLLQMFHVYIPYRKSPMPIANLFFYLTMHMAYEIFWLIIIILYASLSIFINYEEARWKMCWMHFAVTMLFTMDIIFKLIGLSYIWLIFSGIIPFFKRKRNIIEVFFLVLMLINLKLGNEENVYNWWYNYVLPPARLLAVLRLVQIPSTVGFLFPYLIKCIDERIDATLCFDYDLASALLSTTNGLLDILPELIELQMIRDIYQKGLLNEKHTLSSKMVLVQKERPWISITVKTKQAIRSTLSAMQDTLNEFKISGLVDNIEYMFIFEEIFRKHKLVRDLKFVLPSSPDIIFKEILWMGENSTVLDYLLANSHIVKFQTDEIVIKEGTRALGIYIVVTGMLKLKYQPNADTIMLQEMGAVPVIDYLSTTDFNTPIEDNIIPGNSIGEQSILTGRPVACQIYAVSPSTAYWLPSDIIKEAFRMDPDKVDGLESRMWKCSMIHLAMAILMNLPLYKSFTPQQIKLKLERSFVPNLKGFNTFVITELMDDIILIEGIVENKMTGQLFKAPRLIPKTIQKLTFPGTILIQKRDVATVQVRLLIIPIGDAKNNEIMAQEEELAEIVSMTSYEYNIARNERLQHLIDGAIGHIETDDKRLIWTVPSAPLPSATTERKLLEIIKLGKTPSFRMEVINEDEDEELEEDIPIYNNEIENKENKNR